jgi:hypothetical protein
MSNYNPKYFEDGRYDLSEECKRSADEFIESCIKEDDDQEQRDFTDRFEFRTSNTSGIGTSLTLVDTVSGETLDVTNYSNW